MIILATWVLFFSTVSGATETKYPWQFDSAIDQIADINKSQIKECESCKSEKKKIKCDDISDGFCETLWDKNHKGELTLSTGQIHTGFILGTGISKNKIADIQNLINSQERLPADLNAKLIPVIDQYKAILKENKFELADISKIALLDYQLELEIYNVSRERAFSKRPQLKSVSLENMKIEDYAFFKKKKEAIYTEIIDAKYKNHPNWLRITKLFKEAKQDISQVIANMPLLKTQKEKLISKISSVELTLPYNNSSVGADSACTKTTQDAYYSRSINKFTFCAGYINAFQNDSAIYSIMAHEIAHSIDPNNLAYEYTYKYSQVIKTLSELSDHAAPMACEDWDSFYDNTLEPETDIDIISTNPLRKLVNCIAPKDDLDDWSSDRIRNISNVEAKRTMSSSATYNYFTKLIQKKYFKNGELQDNELFMRPDLLHLADNEYSNLKAINRWPRSTEIFTQVVKCLPSVIKNSDKFNSGQWSLSKNDLKLALDRTQLVLQKLYEEDYRYQGQDSVDLVSLKLSKVAQEDFADWVSTRATALFTSRITNLEDRRESAAASSSEFCYEPGPVTAAGALTEVEKSYSFEPHGDDRIRRHSFFTPQMAKLLDCAPAAKGTKVGTCEP